LSVTHGIFSREKTHKLILTAASGRVYFALWCS
jgi:hypothetical protein